MDIFGSMTIDTLRADETDNGTFIQQVAETSFSSVQDPQGYLVPSSTDELNQTDSGQTISTKDLVSWSFQIARGMCYLSSKKVIGSNRACELNDQSKFINFSGSARRLGRTKCFIGG